MIDIDIVGTLYTPGTYDEAGEVITAPVALPGYNVNTTAPVAEWAAYKVYPATPSRVFGGHETHFYTFDNDADYEAILATTNLDPAVIAVPQSVTIRQGCQALEAAGLLQTVEDYIAAAPRYVQIDWERATSIDRNWPTLSVLQTAMELSNTDIDNLFIEAAKL